MTAWLTPSAIAARPLVNSTYELVHKFLLIGNSRLQSRPSNVDSAPAFLKRLPLVDLSRVASTRYAEDFRTGRLVFSRGGLMAAAIDDRIRAETKGAKSLRDALVFLIDWSGRERRGFAIAELAGLIRQATGIDVSQTIERWLQPLD